MQNWAILFIIVGLVAGVLGFAGVGAGTTLTFVFLTIFFVMLLSGGAMLILSKRPSGGRLT